MPVGVEASRGSKVKLFEVTTSIDSTLGSVRPQSSARCRICLRLMKDTIVVPSVCVMDADSTKVVFVRSHTGHVEQREVEVAYASSAEAVVARGIEEGEDLLLLRPADGAIRKKTFLRKD